MRAFLEKIGNEYLDDFVYISKFPLYDMGYEVISFDGDDMDNTLFNKYKINKNDIIIGSVEVTEKFIKHLNVDVPKYLGYPDELRKYLGRNISVCKLSDLGNNFPFFIKPYNDVKKFTGGVMEKQSYIDNIKHFDKISDDYLVYKSEVIEIVSEYRVFCSLGNIYDARFYQGDFKKIVDFEVVNDIIRDFKNPPSSYTLDVGLTSDGKTILIEVNDMWAIGSYGCDSKKYTLLCVRRMNEILNK